MRRLLYSLPVLGAAVAFFSTIGPAQQEGLHWFERYRDALQEAKRTGKPIFLEYRCEP